MKKAQRAAEEIDSSTDATRYKEAVDSLTASISACVGTNLLPEMADIALAARELEQRMRDKLDAKTRTPLKVQHPKVSPTSLLWL